MKIQNQKIIQKFIRFLDSINDSSKIYVLHDTDMDGMSATILLKKGLEKFGKQNIYFDSFKHSNKRNVDQDFLNKLKEHNITHIFSLDIGLESFLGIEKLKEYDVCVIDHHQIESDIWQEMTKLLLIKPYFTVSQGVDGSNICTANLVYNLFSEITNMKNNDWLAAAGIIGDSGYVVEKEFVDSVLKKYGEEVKKDIFETQLGRLVSYTTYGDSMGSEDSLKIIFKALDESKNYGQAIEKMISFKPVEEQMKRECERFDDSCEKIIVNNENIIFYEIKSDYDIKGPVSTFISFKKIPSNTTIITYQKHKNGMTSISARRQDKKYNMGKLMKVISQKLENSQGGGHIPAAGAGIKTEDIKRFKDLVQEFHETIKVE
ncbi:DHH family phosphoesterase [Candidatus Woesearchaeota archaeon]|nr:DHH family phosphoesterase [Candidatus Woesearchaeota archaeon]MCF8013914.1 DHH family phosphoesterase [Candidatus Woesearchaeota archaeon]